MDEKNWRDVEDSVIWIKNFIRKLHKDKPDYFFMTESSGVPFRALVKSSNHQRNN